MWNGLNQILRPMQDWKHCYNGSPLKKMAESPWKKDSDEPYMEGVYWVREVVLTQSFTEQINQSVLYQTNSKCTGSIQTIELDTGIAGSVKTTGIAPYMYGIHGGSASSRAVRYALKLLELSIRTQNSWMTSRSCLGQSSRRTGAESSALRSASRELKLLCFRRCYKKGLLFSI